MSAQYTLKPSMAPRASFGDYEYEIREAGVLIARYAHDYRGDDHRLAFVDGREFDNPIGSVLAFISGGGPEPLRLTKAASEFIDENRPE